MTGFEQEPHIGSLRWRSWNLSAQETDHRAPESVCDWAVQRGPGCAAGTGLCSGDLEKALAAQRRQDSFWEGGNRQDLST